MSLFGAATLLLDDELLREDALFFDDELRLAVCCAGVGAGARMGLTGRQEDGLPTGCSIQGDALRGCGHGSVAWAGGGSGSCTLRIPGGVSSP